MADLGLYFPDRGYVIVSCPHTGISAIFVEILYGKDEILGFEDNFLALNLYTHFHESLAASEKFRILVFRNIVLLN